MKKKIMNIKNILKIIISIFVIFSMVKSCSEASMTKSEAFEYCRDNCGLSSLFNSTGNDSNANLTYNSFLTYLDNQTNPCMFVRKTSTATSNTSFDILFYDNFSIDGNTYNATLNTARKGTIKNCYSFNNLYNTSQYNLNTSGAQGSFPTATNTFYMVYVNGEIIKASFELPPTGLQFTTSTDYINVTIGNETRTDVIRKHKMSTIENPIWGIIQNYNELNTWELFYGMYLVMPDGTEYVINDPYLEFINNEQRYVRSKGLDIEIGKLYKLEITYQENLESYYYFIDDYFNPIPTGSTITYDYTSGDTQYTIQDQMQQQQQNQDFWQKAYNSLFVVDSGDIKQVVDNFMNSANLEQYGDISGELMILNTLRGTPTDFVISWSPVQWQRKNNNTKWRYKF